MIEYLACHAICYDWICDWVSQLVTFNHMLNYVSTQLVYFPWIDLSNSIPMTRYNSFQSCSRWNDSNSLLIIPLNYSDPGVLPLNSPVEDVERLSQSCFREYYWLVPYLTQNTRGQYIPILQAVLITPTHMVLNERFKVSIILFSSCEKVIITWIYSAHSVPDCDRRSWLVWSNESLGRRGSCWGFSMGAKRIWHRINSPLW